MTDLDIERIELAVLDIKPGQVLVVRIYGNPKQADMQLLNAMLDGALPHVKRLIVSQAVEFSVIDAPAD